MCGGMVDIQSLTVRLGEGKKRKKEDRKKSQDKNIMTASVTQGGHNNSASIRQAVFPDINNACREQMLS